jgi:hypothetical protein
MKILQDDGKYWPGQYIIYVLNFLDFFAHFEEEKQGTENKGVTHSHLFS